MGTDPKRTLDPTTRAGETIILGVDPGSRNTGFAVIAQQGRRLRVVNSGTIRLPAKLDLCHRLARLLHELDEVVSNNTPDTAAVEDVFTHRNARSALALGQARGVVMAVIGSKLLEVCSYPPATVKKAVGGHGRADKQQIQRMVQVLLSLDYLPPTDEADAMAIAICHALHHRTNMGTEQKRPGERER